jgi:3-phenylpropionate/cinnamic acid dioxygenase small subunit
VADNEILGLIDALHLRYTRALDNQDMDAWLACFSRDGGYVCTTRESEQQSLRVALMLDDSYDRLTDRVRYVTKVWNGTFEDYTTRHIVQRVSCAPAADAWTVESNFIVAYTTSAGSSDMLATGLYRDEIVIDAGTAALRSRTAVLDTITTPRYLVYPI